MHQVQQDFYTSEMRVLRSLIIFMLVTMVVILLFVSKILTVKRHVEEVKRSQLENLKWLGMDWDESPQTHEKISPIRTFGHLPKNTLTNCWQKVKLTNHTLLKKN